MVTGDLALGGAGSSARQPAAATSACPDPVSVGVDKFPQPAFSNQAGAVNPATGWADFSNPALFSNFRAGGGDPWTPEATPTDPASPRFAPFASSSSSPLTQTAPPADSFGGVGRGDTGITARVEGVYIDMRKRREGEEEEGGDGCEYVAPGDVTKDQAFLDFLLFQ